MKWCEACGVDVAGLVVGGGALSPPLRRWQGRGKARRCRVGGGGDKVSLRKKTLERGRPLAGSLQEGRCKSPVGNYLMMPYSSFIIKMRVTDWLIRSIVSFPS